MFGDPALIDTCADDADLLCQHSHGRVKINSIRRQQDSHGSFKQSLPATVDPSPLEAVEQSIPSSSGRMSSRASGNCPSSFQRNSRTGNPTVGETTVYDQVLCAQPAYQDYLVQFMAPSADTNLQQTMTVTGSSESLEAIPNANEDTEIPEQQSLPSQNGNPARILPHGTTTIVVRNIPARFSQEGLLQLWPADGKYNLMYVPFNFQMRRRSGMAIINMISCESAAQFTATWHGQKLLQGRSGKGLDIGAAVHQGFIENLKYLKKLNVSKIRNNDFLPMAFKGARQLDIKALLAQTDLTTIDEQQLELFVPASSTSFDT